MPNLLHMLQTNVEVGVVKRLLLSLLLTQHLVYYIYLDWSVEVGVVKLPRRLAPFAHKFVQLKLLQILKLAVLKYCKTCRRMLK